MVSVEANLSCSSQSCSSILCVTPPWDFGFRRTSVSVERFVQESNLTDWGWIPLIQRVCLQRDCGFIPTTERTASLWYTTAARYLNQNLTGTFTSFYFLTSSEVYQRETNDSSWTFVTTLLPWSLSRESWEASSTAPFQSCGYSSFLRFEVGGNDYFLAARSWDSVSLQVHSYLFGFNRSNSLLYEIQAVPTNGARQVPSESFM